MARIMPTLETGDNIGAAGQPIDDLTFTLISPLGADNDNIGHDEPRKTKKRDRA